MSTIKYLEYCDCKILECYSKGDLFEALVVSPSGNRLIVRTYNDIITNIDIDIDM